VRDSRLRRTLEAAVSCLQGEYNRRGRPAEHTKWDFLTIHKFMRWQNATQAKGSLEFGGGSRTLPAAFGNSPAALPQEVMDWLSQQKESEPKTEAPKASRDGHYVLEKAVLADGEAVYYLVDPNPDTKVDVELDRGSTWTIYSAAINGQTRQCLWRGEPHDPVLAEEVAHKYRMEKGAGLNLNTPTVPKGLPAGPPPQKSKDSLKAGSAI